MPSISSSSIKWNGALTIPQLTAKLFKRQQTVLRLPTSYHPMVSARLYQNSRARKSIDLLGDAKLLARIAEIEGLAELRRLVTTMEMVGARLRLRSPAPHLICNVPSTARLAKPRELQQGEAWIARDDAEVCGSCGVRRARNSSADARTARRNARLGQVFLELAATLSQVSRFVVRLDL